jgi:hypothetical protein
MYVAFINAVGKIIINNRQKCLQVCEESLKGAPLGSVPSLPERLARDKRSSLLQYRRKKFYSKGHIGLSPIQHLTGKIMPTLTNGSCAITHFTAVMVCVP